MLAVTIVAAASSGLVLPSSTARVVTHAPQRSSVSMMSARNVPNKMVWVDFGPLPKKGEISAGFQYGQEIAIVNEPNGGLYAISNKLPPTGQPATYADFGEKGNIVDPVSRTQFSLKTGKPVGTWCPSPVGKIISFLVSPTNVPTFPVRKSGNKAQVLINVNAKAQFEAQYWRGVLDAQGKVDGGYY